MKKTTSKRILVVFLTLCCFAFGACGGEDSGDINDPGIADPKGGDPKVVTPPPPPGPADECTINEDCGTVVCECPEFTVTIAACVLGDDTSYECMRSDQCGQFGVCDE